MATVYKDVEVEVEVDLDDFSDRELLEELEVRGLHRVYADALLERIYYAKTSGQPYDKLVDQLLYETIGRIV